MLNELKEDLKKVSSAEKAKASQWRDAARNWQELLGKVFSRFSRKIRFHYAQNYSKIFN